MIASDVLLLLLDDRTGQPESVVADTAVTGGVLADLALAGRIRLTDGDDPEGEGRVAVVDATPLDDAVLDPALAAVADAGGRRLPTVLTAMRAVGSDVMERVAERLVEEGALTRAEPGVLAALRRTRYVEADGGPERALRDRLVTVLAGEREASPEEAAVIALVYAAEAVGAVFGPDLPEVNPRELQARAERYAKGAWARSADVVTQQVAALSFGVISTIMTTTTVITTIP